MDFSSIEFFGFFAITVIVYFIVKPTRKWLVLLLASGVFLYTFSFTFLLYTLLYTLLNYFLARSIYHAKNQLIKRVVYLSAININIGLLVFFKYINFILENLFQLLGVFADVGEPPVLTILIPLGISFYTFQTIGYIIDVNRGVWEPEKNIGKFLLFILYFPKFVSGPVERANSLLPEINKTWLRDDSNIYLGISQALWGFFKKIIIADRLSVLVNTLNGDLESYSGGVLILLFFIQFLYLYCDFSGYTDIVLGISRIFGIRLRENFNRPLFAKSVTDYWRRWHISFTSWCNEYIFKRIMLKRMKWKKWAPIYGAFITFLIIGIWHGASWNFVILGLLQGLAISYEYLSRRSRIRIGNKIPSWINTSASRLLVLIFICFSHVFFFSPDLHGAMHFFSGMFDFQSDYPQFSNLPLEIRDWIIIVAGLVIVYLIEFREEQGSGSLKEYITARPVIRWTGYVAAIILLIILRADTDGGFIYTQF